MAELTPPALRSYTKGCGALYVMMAGISMMAMLYAVSLVSPARPLSTAVQNLVWERILSGWITFAATERRLQYLTAPIMAGQQRTVLTERM